MTWAEIQTLLKYDYYSVKDQWEQARLVAYMTAQVNSKRKLTFQDIVEFPWENEEDEEEVKPISQEEIKRLQEKAKEYGKSIR